MRFTKMHGLGNDYIFLNCLEGMRAVGGGPGHVAGGLKAGDQPLVGVHQGVGDGRHPLHVAENARDEGVALPGQALLPFLVKECVFAVLERAKVMGYDTFNVGPEAEFFLFQTDEDGKPTTKTNDEAGYFVLVCIPFPARP